MLRFRSRDTLPQLRKLRDLLPTSPYLPRSNNILLLNGYRLLLAQTRRRKERRRLRRRGTRSSTRSGRHVVQQLFSTLIHTRFQRTTSCQAPGSRMGEEAKAASERHRRLTRGPTRCGSSTDATYPHPVTAPEAPFAAAGPASSSELNRYQASKPRAAFLLRSHVFLSS